MVRFWRRPKKLAVRVLQFKPYLKISNLSVLEYDIEQGHH